MTTAAAPDPVEPFQALGDANRQRIVELLAQRPHAVGELADVMPISRPAISRHLRLLKEAGLVDDTPDGTRRIYELRDEGVAAIEQWLTSVWGDALTRFRLTAENLTAEHLTAERPTAEHLTAEHLAPEHTTPRDDQ